MAEIAKSSEMPEPQVVNYGEKYKITDLFINDLKKVLADLPYVEAKKFFDKIEEHKHVMFIAQLNEFIRDLSYLPYKIVGKLMVVINNKENFIKYFSPVTQSDELQKN